MQIKEQLELKYTLVIETPGHVHVCTVCVNAHVAVYGGRGIGGEGIGEGGGKGKNQYHFHVFRMNK